LTALGHGIVTAESAEKAVVLLDVISPDLVITDVHVRGAGIRAWWRRSWA